MDRAVLRGALRGSGMKRSPARSFRHRGEYLALRSALSVLGLGGDSGARWLGRLLGGLAFHLGIRKRIARANLAAAFPELSQVERERILRACYRHFGITFLELLRLPRWSAAKILSRVEIANPDAFRDAMGVGRGGVLVSGHIGNWEVVGGAIAALGYPMWITVKTQRNPWIDAFVTSARESTGMRVLRVEAGFRAMLRKLRENQFLTFLQDQDAGRRGTFVRFFGQPASTAIGPVRFARLAGCAIISGYAIRQNDGSFYLHMPPLRFVDPERPAEEAERETLALLVQDLEVVVRQYPEQWFWMHRRWKTVPPE